jgi:serine/threonine protein phosphatase PrpC
MRIDIASQSDIGRRKKNNEDYMGVFGEDTPGLQLFSDGALLVVADGLGGHVGGEIASKLAVSVVKGVIQEPPPPPPADGEADEGFLPLMHRYVTLANENIHQTNQDLVRSGRPMGTTLLTGIVTPRKLYLNNVGDSRCYLFRDGDIISKTEDHSWVDEQVKLGLMTKAEAESDSRRALVTRSVGTHPQVEIDSYQWDIVPGDMLLLCTDGLVNMVKDAEIALEFRKNASPSEIAKLLVDTANDNGGKDNITVIVADVSPSLVTLANRKFKAFSRKRGAGIFWACLALVYGAFMLLCGYWLGGGFTKTP